MRRTDREMPREFGLMVVDSCEYANLAMIDESGLPYVLPMTIVREGEAVYFHSALEGKKTLCLKKNPNVSLSCVGATKRATDAFTTEFESAILSGTAVEVTEDAEKIHALRLLCERHTPTNMSMFDTSIEKSLGRTGIWKITIETLTAKRKKFDAHGKEMKFGRME